VHGKTYAFVQFKHEHSINIALEKVRSCIHHSMSHTRQQINGTRLFGNDIVVNKVGFIPPPVFSLTSAGKRLQEAGRGLPGYCVLLTYLTRAAGR
jgi:hypothetical protein